MPKITNVISNTKTSAIENTAKIILKSAENEYTKREMLGTLDQVNNPILCSDLIKLNETDYSSCTISFSNRNAYINIIGSGKLENEACIGFSKNNFNCEKKIPSIYKRIEYLENNRLQYINTGVLPSNTVEVLIDYKIISGYDSAGSVKIFGSRISFNNQYYIDNDVTGAFIRTAFGEQNNNASSTFDSNRHIMNSMIDRTKNLILFMIDDEVIYSYDKNKTFSTTQPIYIYAVNNNGTTLISRQLRIYDAKIYDNGILIRNFVPVINGTTAGMYDLINNEFYDSSGENAFVTGNVLYNE